MLYLVNEVYKFKGKKIKIYFDKPIPYQTFDKSKKPLGWAEEVKNLVYKIPSKFNS